MTAMNRIVTLLLVVGAFFSGSTRQLLNVAKNARSSPLIYAGRDSSSGRDGSGGSGMGG